MELPARQNDAAERILPIAGGDGLGHPDREGVVERRHEGTNEVGRGLGLERKVPSTGDIPEPGLEVEVRELGDVLLFVFYVGLSVQEEFEEGPDAEVVRGRDDEPTLWQ
jgi:hypothetical protein